MSGFYAEAKNLTQEASAASGYQVGGNHYKGMAIQPVDYIHSNGLGYLEGNVVKYVSRHKAKNGAEDIRKAMHYCQYILDRDYPENLTLKNDSPENS